MSIEPIPPRGAGAVVAILLGPLRAIERARGWRRLGLLLLYVMIALPVLAPLWRRSQLAGVPDVGNTFDVPAAQPTARVPEDRNAFVLYRRAAERFRDLSKDEEESYSTTNFRWSAADTALRGWVAENREAVSLLRAGSERPEAYLEQPASTDVLALSERQEFIQRLLLIGDAALFEAGRLRAEGDPAGAWALLKAVVRASRDLQRAMPTASCQISAMTLVQDAHRPVAEWAQDPSVGVALLRRALDDLTAAEALTPPLSDFYRGEYQAADEFLENGLQTLIAERARHLADARVFDLSAFAPGLDAYLRGEPERSRRVLRLLAANDLAWCDRPASERPPLAVPRLRIYQADPSTPPAARALPPEELARWAESVLIHPAPPWRMGDLEEWGQNDRRSVGQLKEAVAVPLFTCEMGRPPASPAEALRRYLPIPGDTFDRDEAEPLPESAGAGPPR
jgi:hypothetical protein